MGLFDGKNNQNQVVNPITFVGENWREKPLSYMDKDINGATSFAILKTTEGGKYMRGNMLYYSLNGVEVYTEENNIIFVDTKNGTLFIRDYSKVIDGISPSDPELKQYVILYTDLGFENSSDDNEFPLRWEAVQGRTAAYEAIKSSLAVVDIDKSVVLVESVPLKDALSIREFVKYLQNADMVDKDEIDIDSYTGSEYI